MEHLLNKLVRAMPDDECYLEVGTLEGRTLEAASVGNDTKRIYGVDPCEKYDLLPEPFSPNVVFFKNSWQQFLKQVDLPMPVGACFYDADHSAWQTQDFMAQVEGFLADEAVLVLDDWDRESVRTGAFRAGHHWTLLRECPEYTDGLNTTMHHFGYSFGIGIWGFKR